MKTNSGCASPMKEYKIKPAGAIIRSIDILYTIYEGTNALCGLRFNDKDANTLLQCGHFYPPDSKFINHTMVVNEDERIVGVRSKTGKGVNWVGTHFDIEFLLWKLK